MLILHMVNTYCVFDWCEACENIATADCATICSRTEGVISEVTSISKCATQQTAGFGQCLKIAHGILKPVLQCAKTMHGFYP